MEKFYIFQALQKGTFCYWNNFLEMTEQSTKETKPTIPGAGASILWGLAGLILFPLPLIGVVCGVVAITKAQTAKTYLKGREEEYLGEATAKLGYRLGITAVIFAHLGYLAVAAYLRMGMQ